MAQLNFPNEPIKPPPHYQIFSEQGGSNLPILNVLKECYLLWHNFLVVLPRVARYSLGLKIDKIFTDTLEILLMAQFTRHENKKIFLNSLSQKLDNLKFFVTLLWETKSIDQNKYAQLAQKLTTAGRMLGKWLQSLN